MSLDYIMLHNVQFTLQYILYAAYLNTVITETAVRAARWPIELAGITPLHLDMYPIYINCSVQRLSEVIFIICMLCSDVCVRVQLSYELYIFSG